MELKSKLILEEPGDEAKLPDVVPEEPIVVSTEPEGEPKDEVDAGLETKALASLLMDEISKSYDDIGRANSLIATFADAGHDDVIELLNDIVDKRTIVIGELHTALASVDPETGGLIYDGMGDLELDSENEKGPLDEKVTRSDRRIAKAVNKHLQENGKTFRVYVYEIDPTYGVKISNTEQEIGDFATRKEAIEQAEATIDSWNENHANKKYKYVIRTV